eukprot:SAG31_NODE_11611_length_1013_cov_1.469365_1_plen_215_part_00
MRSAGGCDAETILPEFVDGLPGAAKPYTICGDDAAPHHALCMVERARTCRTLQNNDQCQAGTFCGGNKGDKNCRYCGTHAPLDMTFDMVTGDSWNFPEDQGRHLGFNKTHVLEVCRDPTLSFRVKPPDGRGNHPGTLAYTCVELSRGINDGSTISRISTGARDPAFEPPFERTAILCPGATELGVPSPGYKTFGKFQFLFWCVCFLICGSRAMW